MNRQQIPERSTMLDNLRRKLRKPDTECDSHTEALTELAELEAHGRSDDGDQRFAAFTNHMDECVRCAEEFDSLVRRIRANRDRVAPAAAATRTFPAFFPTPAPAPTKIRAQDNFILKVWEGVKRKLELELAPVLMGQKVAVMSEENVFASQVTELSDPPLFAVKAQRSGDAATVRVAIMDLRGVAWEVRITTGGVARSQVTNQHGIAEFDQVPITALATGLRVVCEERAG